MAKLPAKSSPDYSRFKVGSLFAAIGGFCKAFQLAGAIPLWANELDKFAAETFRANFPTSDGKGRPARDGERPINYVHKDVKDLTVIGDGLEPVDILTAGFPCQPFSVAGEKLGFEDERGLLFLHIIRLIRKFGPEKPKALLLENVKNLKTHDRGRTFKRIQSEIQKAGYWFQEPNTRIMNTSHYTDIPQNRERIFMVALSCDHFPSNTYKFPDPLPPGSCRPVRSFLDLETKPDSDWYYFKPGSQYYPLFKEAIDNGDKGSIYQLRRSYVRENKSDTCFTLAISRAFSCRVLAVLLGFWAIIPGIADS